MVAFELDFENRPPPTPRRDSGSVKYRLDVVASSAADVVGSIGGWLYDRVRAGWDVNVLLAQECDDRPLQILGMHAVEPRPANPLRGAPNARPAVWPSARTCSPPTCGSGRRCWRRWIAG